jgi:DNA topoisomerase-3
MYLAQFYSPERYRSDVVEIACEGHSFRATNKTVLSPGWRVLYRSDDAGTREAAEDTTPPSDLSPFATGDRGTCAGLDIDEKKTKPLSRYTIATLLKDLTRVAKYVTDTRLRDLLRDKDKDKKGEHGGIGTPSTRDVIIKNLIERGYLVESGKYIMSTEFGRKFYDLLPDAARTPDMTALWHEEQSAIAAGNRTIDEFLSDLVAFIAKEVSQIREHGLSFTVDGEPCPICEKGVLLKRKGSNGLFWGCSRYPDCKASYPNVRGKPELTPRLQLVPSNTYHCEKCGKPLIRRPAKKGSGFWWGCSGYPACTERYFDSNGKPMHGAGDADQKKKKNGTRGG